jgi:hypothetical protein
MGPASAADKSVPGYQRAGWAHFRKGYLHAGCRELGEDHPKGGGKNTIEISELKKWTASHKDTPARCKRFLKEFS